MQEIFRIEGSAAPSLEGSIRVVGAKNAVLKAMAASVLYRTPLSLTDVRLGFGLDAPVLQLAQGQLAPPFRAEIS